MEPFTVAEHPLTALQLRELLGSCDIFSPNEDEAVSMLGASSSSGSTNRSGLHTKDLCPSELADRCLVLSPQCE